MSADERFSEIELSAQFKAATNAPNMDIFYRDYDRVMAAMALADSGRCLTCGEKCKIDEERTICPVCNEDDYYDFQLDTGTKIDYTVFTVEEETQAKGQGKAMESINWNLKQSIAKKMSNDELIFAINDCSECIRALGNDEMKGKDSNYYRDEMSIYSQELERRKMKKKG